MADEFAARLRVPLSGLAQVLTGDRETAAALVHTALTRAYADRTPDELRTIAVLVRAWAAGGPPVGEPDELPYDLELLRRALDALPDKQRVAVALHHWSGLAVADIAAVVRRPERAVAADLAAGVADLPADPGEGLAALVAAAGEPLVDLAEVAEAGRAQRRHRRRVAVAAAGVLLAVTTAAALLPGSGADPDGAFSREMTVDELRSQPVVTEKARRLTEQLAAVLADVLPGVTDLSPGRSGRPPLEFATSPQQGPVITYLAEARFGTTRLAVYVQFGPPEWYPPSCSTGGEWLDCTARELPDGTEAWTLAFAEGGNTLHGLVARRPDGTVTGAVVDDVESVGPPELTGEDLLPFATVFSS